MKRKRTIRLSLLFVFFLILGQLVSSCLTFRLTHAEVEEKFAQTDQKVAYNAFPLETYQLSYMEQESSAATSAVFIHGSPGSSSAFIDFFKDEELSQNLKIISVDRPGFGHSNFGRAEPDLQVQAQLMMAILDKTSTGPIILIGHSLGGPVAARMAMDYPERISGIIMVAPSIAPELEPEEWFRKPLHGSFLRYLLPRSFRASNDEIFYLKKELVLMEDKWKDIACDVVVIQGMQDKLVPPANADYAKKMITNAPVKIIKVEDMNHFVPWTHPHLIKDAILRLQEKIASPIISPN